ncbi:site-2 protease family protein [Microbacterium sp. BWT-B31]|uniref:M50 family metallopeptidase n=1 Tax=Microbacterium sp. BWT-B31 TaxID=3232072 RepID=UPI003528A737
MTVVAFIIGIVLLVVGLAVSIALHELGHMLPAKKFGVRVGQYMIGFGPTLWSRRRGETEYGVKAIPLGGYISMAGMYPPSPAKADGSAGRAGRAGGGFFATMVQDARAANDLTLETDDDPRVFYRLPVWKRVVVMLGGPFMNLVLAIVLFTILLSGIGVQAATTTIDSVSECVIPSGEQRTACEASDPAAPAAQAGLQPGDVLVSVAGQPVDTFAESSAIVRESAGQTIPVVVERDGDEVTLRLTPTAVSVPETDAAGQVVTDAEGDPVMTEVGYAGMRAQLAYVPQPIWSGAEATFAQVGAVAGIVWKLPAMVWDTAVATVTGQERDPNGPLSVVGAGVLAGEVAASDQPVLNRISGLLGLLASLNVALFVFNLIPLLPLDGGHVAVALWDGTKRVWAKLTDRPSPKPVDATKLVPVTFVVVVALIAMGAVLIISDLVNPISLLG